MYLKLQSSDSQQNNTMRVGQKEDDCQTNSLGTADFPDFIINFFARRIVISKKPQYHAPV
jgi:hypothetical protein